MLAGSVVHYRLLRCQPLSSFSRSREIRDCCEYGDHWKHHFCSRNYDGCDDQPDQSPVAGKALPRGWSSLRRHCQPEGSQQHADSQQCPLQAFVVGIENQNDRSHNADNRKYANVNSFVSKCVFTHHAVCRSHNLLKLCQRFGLPPG